MDAKLTDEPGRLAALLRYEVLDTPHEAPFDRITKLVQTVLDVPIVTVSLLDSDRQWFKSCAGIESESVNRELSFCTFTIQGREPLSITDTTLDERFMRNPFVTGEPQIRSYMGAPLATPDGYNVGSLCAIDNKPRTYSSKQMEMLVSFASLVVNELELRRIAMTDQLTGAATRRGFLLEMERLLARSSRNGRPNSLILLDVDHFKKINDTYGHPTGDSVLRNISGRLKQVFRTGDVLGRMGGEEFGVLLPDTDREFAYEIAERLRLSVALDPITENPKLQVTASFGIACWQSSYASAEEWLSDADNGLYQAKRMGRNRSCFHDSLSATHSDS